MSVCQHAVSFLKGWYKKKNQERKQRMEAEKEEKKKRVASILSSLPEHLREEEEGLASSFLLKENGFHPFEVAENVK